MIIRAAVKNDIPQIAQLQKQLSDEEIIYGFMPETAGEIAKYQYLPVAGIDGEIIGFISGNLRTSEGSAVVPKGAKYLEIENLYVALEYRKQGVGGRLVDELLTRARCGDAAYALLYSATKDIHSILRFYEQHDFQSWYVQMFQKL
ncbi:MAG TPA: GNAT family N-acetyltransferase [Pyrinomonadaceae bacterium]|jgi:ribosomal protein S18 acetylase RimI-like enzyme